MPEKACIFHYHIPATTALAITFVFISKSLQTPYEHFLDLEIAAKRHYLARIYKAF